MSEAPERIRVARCHPFKEPDDFYVCHPRLQHPADVEYIRADLLAAKDAEIERLRKALEDIADGCGETQLHNIGRFAHVVARAALTDPAAPLPDQK